MRVNQFIVIIGKCSIKRRFRFKSNDYRINDTAEDFLVLAKYNLYIWLSDVIKYVFQLSSQSKAFFIKIREGKGHLQKRYEH